MDDWNLDKLSLFSLMLTSAADNLENHEFIVLLLFSNAIDITATIRTVAVAVMIPNTVVASAVVVAVVIDYYFY